MNKVLFSFLLFAFSASAVQGQNVIFPLLEEDVLLQALRVSYKPTTVLEYGPARDVMYGTFDKINDSVSCIYSGYTLALPNGVDPSSYLYQNSPSNGITCEHSYPQSKGASDGNAKSDMHHLFPAKGSVNTARGNNPLGEVNDNNATGWYYKDLKLSSKPNSNIDAYSELGEGLFEPREAVKGDLARAIFYFFTMYRNEALAADPVFFELQRDDLCDWHFMDPADDKEMLRTLSIAQYQEGKANPFILDCTLAARTYCLDTPNACGIVLSTPTLEAAILPLEIYPNPSFGLTNLRFTLEKSSTLYLEVLNLLGQSILKSENTSYEAGTHQMPFYIDQKGIYIARIQLDNGLVRVVKFVVE